MEKILSIQRQVVDQTKMWTITTLRNKMKISGKDSNRKIINKKWDIDMNGLIQTWETKNTNIDMNNSKIKERIGYLVRKNLNSQRIGTLKEIITSSQSRTCKWISLSPKRQAILEYMNSQTLCNHQSLFRRILITPYSLVRQKIVLWTLVLKIAICQWMKVSKLVMHMNQCTNLQRSQK